MNNFINNYFNNEEYFYIFLLNRIETEINFKGKVVKKTREYKHNLKSFNEWYQKFQTMNKNHNWDIYFSINPFKTDSKNRYEINVSEYKSLFFDIDEDGENTAKKIISTLGSSTYTIRTSKEKYQLIYQLETPFKGNFEELKEYKEVLKILTYHFKTDHTFDLSRVGRVPELINNKNDWNIKYKNNNILYNIEHFKKYIIDNDIKIPAKTPKKTPKKTLKDKPMEIYEDNVLHDNINYEKYLKSYNHLKKYNKDLSAVDFTFIKRYKEELEEDFEDILSILRYCREDLMEKHGHEIERYITLKIEDS
ncbi:hypothetical protein JHD48_09810 [Sulfurimonas sp. SAG-AH-194-I05]|nr:DNA-primase RepB domain-containing protein [Sulfurimonas sp. SAG-AH-194-I05]MDF1876031.1 hypothetical protein [Sulfurimonas sp. SAG-AH-194-I05]